VLLDCVNWAVLSVRMQTLGMGWLFGRNDTQSMSKIGSFH
jgi:hypothetical protein